MLHQFSNTNLALVIIQFQRSLDHDCWQAVFYLGRVVVHGSWIFDLAMGSRKMNLH